MVIRRKAGFSFETFILGFAAGAAAGLLLDRRRGAARRALVRDKTLSTARSIAAEVVRSARDIGNRGRGRIYELTHADETVPDGLLVERVRAQIGRAVSHSRPLRVEATDGCVVLSGPILSAEVAPLLEIVCKVRGVKSIESQLDVHEDAGTEPSLQAGGERSGAAGTPRPTR